MSAALHPGHRLAKLLAKHGITPYRCARAIGESPPRMYEVVKGLRPVTLQLALRLGRYFGDGADAWLDAQVRYELAALPRDVTEAISRIEPLGAPVAKKKTPRKTRKSP